MNRCELHPTLPGVWICPSIRCPHPICDWATFSPGGRIPEQPLEPWRGELRPGAEEIAPLL